jgi:hypothetical protein
MLIEAAGFERAAIKERAFLRRVDVNYNRLARCDAEARGGVPVRKMRPASINRTIVRDDETTIDRQGFRRTSPAPGTRPTC